MRSLTLLAQSPVADLGPVEVTFFKILALCVMILWAIYLIKEIFTTHKEDPRMTDLIGGMQQTGVQLAVLANNITHLTAANHDQREREKEMWMVINGMRKSLTTIAEDHAHLEGQAQAHKTPLTRPR